MSEFIKVGNDFINLGNVTEVYTGFKDSSLVKVYFNVSNDNEQALMEITGERATAFLWYLDNNIEIDVLPAYQAHLREAEEAKVMKERSVKEVAATNRIFDSPGYQAIYETLDSYRRQNMNRELGNYLDETETELLEEANFEDFQAWQEVQG